MSELIDTISREKVFAVIRTETADQARSVGHACVRGGMRLLEITLTIPDAWSVVAGLRAEPSAVVGVGSVVTPEQVRKAAEVGARFVVSPHFDPDIVAAAKAAGLLVSQGGVTATEAMTCHKAGVDIIKIFPSSVFGPGYLKALRDPLPFLRLMPTGGVDMTNLADWLDAGAFAAGLGGSLFDKKTVAAGDWATIEVRARHAVEAVRKWTEARGR